jgi:catalase
METASRSALTEGKIASNASVTEGAASVRLVDALNGVFGRQRVNRAIHAKGIVLKGVFTPAATGATVSKAPHFNGGKVRVTVRFSDFSGIPSVSDTDGLATPRGMAIKFHLSNGSHTDIVAHSVNAFPAATAEDFRQLMIAIGTSGSGVSPTPAAIYMDSHPAAKAFFDNMPAPPVSFATVAYFGVNSFKFTSATGDDCFGRYQLIPHAGVQFLSRASIATADRDYLSHELKQRISTNPVLFLLQVQIATALDAVGDPSVTWRDSNPTISLGTIAIQSLVTNSDEVEQNLIFSPAATTDGIAPADPMIEARNGAYSVSYARRHTSL